MHGFLARFFDAPELELSDEEAKRFTTAYAEFRKHFALPVIDPKWLAVATLAGVSFQIYSPRVSAVIARKKAGQPAPTREVRGNVVSFATTGNTAGGAAPEAASWLTPDAPGGPPN